MNIQTYYRKLAVGEIMQQGDVCNRTHCNTLQPIVNNIGRAVYFGNDVFRPVIISENIPAKPEPVHRVEEETWSVWEGGIVTDQIPFQGYPDDVCVPPGSHTSGFKLWPQRAKRICAGQDALKLLERLYTPANIGWTGFDEERQRILSLLK